MSLTVDSNEKLPAIAADLSKIADVKYEGQQGAGVHGGREYSRTEWHCSAGIQAIRHVNVRMISQGAREINMSFMIDEDDVDEAVRSLHAYFFQNPDPAIFDVEAREAARAAAESVKR